MIYQHIFYGKIFKRERAYIFHTVKWFQAFLSNTNISIYY